MFPNIGRHARVLHLLLQQRHIVVILVVLTQLVLDCPNLFTITLRPSARSPKVSTSDGKRTPLTNNAKRHLPTEAPLSLTC